MKINTITTLELSSLCNLSCQWCINRLLIKHPARKAGIMSNAVFEASLELLKVLVKRGTQKELNLNGNGESLLDSRLLSRIARLRNELGDKIVLQFSTNGILLNPSMAAGLKQAGISRVDLSAHDITAARKARCYLIAAKLNGIVTNGPVSGAHNWAGQLEPENRVSVEPIGLRCDPLIEGRAYIQSEGDIVPCCYDYRNLGKFAHVFDPDALEREMKPFTLCETCHQVIPKNAIAHSECKSMIASCAS
jgi:hypothetical protein